MKENKVGLIVTARIKSSRIPNKVLQEIKGQKTIEILLDNLSNKIYPVILAIPENSDDDMLQEIGDTKGVEVYRGQDDSPMHRLLAVAKEYGFEDIVRITADDILIDQMLLRRQIDFHLKGGYDYTYMIRCPEGIAGEVIKTSALEKAVENIGDEPIEFVSYYLKTKEFNIKEYYPPFEYQFSFRLTMDYVEDLMLLKEVYSSLAEPFGTLDIINFLKSHKYLMQINHLPKITVYTCNYNMSDYIVQCIDSVVAQTFEDWEYLIIDDCSTDKSLERIVEYYSSLPLDIQKKIKILRNNENIGLPASCNKMLKMSRGKYIIRVDADDMFDIGALNKMHYEIRLDDNIEGLISGYAKVDESGDPLITIEENHWHPGCCLLSKKAVNELRYKEHLEHYEGLDFFNRFNELYHIKFIPDILWNYRQHDNQKSSIKNVEERREVKKEIGAEIIQGSGTSL